MADAVLMQRFLKKRNTVTVPVLQVECGVSYSEAKEILRDLQERGWAEEACRGIEYGVIKDNLNLRDIERSEVDTLYEKVDLSSAYALELFDKSRGITYDEISDVIHDSDETDEVILNLTQLRLVYTYRRRIFLRVSEKAAQVIAQAAKMKFPRTRGFEAKVRVNEAEIKKLYDQLF